MFEEMKVNELREVEGGDGGAIALVIILLVAGCLSSCSNSCDE